MSVKQQPAGQMVRCAIYTRKSTSIGLDMRLNSLETQREVCRAYIRCQEHRNWVEVNDRYDDGGFSGGTLDRPALQRLITDIETGRIDIVVIYKIDRLSRSLTDFIRLMDVMEKYQTSFVSVTQTFDTSDSMGRLVLNILLTFAQFERELMSERVKDRFAAKKKRGLFCGGTPPVGYLVKKGGKLIPDPERADVIRGAFLKYPTSSAAELARELQACNFRSRLYVSRHHGRQRGGRPIYPKDVVSLLRNPVYAGHFLYRGELQRAEVEPLVSLEHWQYVQALIEQRAPHARNPIENPLLGILFDEIGRPMRVLNDGAGKSNRCRHYYSANTVWARGSGVRKVMVESHRVEELAVSAIQGLLTDRIKLRTMILSLGVYNAETARALRKGHLAARRVSQFNPTQLREFLVAVVLRAEVTRTELRLMISCHELTRFISWDGTGTFQKAAVLPRGADRFRMIYAPAYLVCGHSYFAMPLLPRQSEGSPSPELVKVLDDAKAVRELAFANRDMTVAELARKRNIGVPLFTRLMRINYLAPDIQAAILDGTHPADLTRKKLLFGSLPLDWEQQRHLLGFRPLP